jgi:hypothetical protein
MLLKLSSLQNNYLIYMTQPYKKFEENILSVHNKLDHYIFVNIFHFHENSPEAIFLVVHDPFINEL